jgi:hypothetical protein
VVDSYEQTHSTVREAGQEPHLPQWAHRVQALPEEHFDRSEEFGLSDWRLERQQPDVVAQVDHWRIHPQWSTEAASRLMDELAEARDEVEPAFDGIAHGVDSERADLVVQRTTVEDGEHAEVLRPPPAGHEHQAIESG